MSALFPDDLAIRFFPDPGGITPLIPPYFRQETKPKDAFTFIPTSKKD
jgi:hypothetical protein